MTDTHRSAPDASPWSRREFVQRGLVLASAAAMVPSFVQRSAFGMPQPAAGMGSIPGVPEDRVLVVIQLSGGNDGLNTVVPYGFDAYYRARPSIAVEESDVLRLGRGSRDPVGFHPAAAGIKGLFDEGLVSVVQGVGYPNPNRSHFKSMDIWHTADTTGTGDGWLGRYVDAECCGFGKGESGTAESPAANEPPVAIGRDAPLALLGRRTKPVAFETADLFRWTGGEIHESLVEPYERLASEASDAPSGSNAEFLTKVGLDARVSSRRIREAVAARPLVGYPRSELARQLSMVANMIRAGMKTRVYYVTHGGFDTHAGQGGTNGRHANLLRQFAEAVAAFQQDLRAQGNDGRVLTMSFSEFGRRVAQNASRGTDHGTAAPMMLFGPMVNAGVLNPHPSLTDLDQGDLKFTVDFRSVYAAILDTWLGADSRAILDGRYKPAPVLARA